MNQISYLFLLNIIIFVFATPTFADTSVPAKQHHSASFESLSNTDGIGLLSKPPLYTNEQRKHFFEEGKQACAATCVTEFGAELGIADGVKGFSNCRSMCINPEYSFLDLDTKTLSVHTEDPKKDNLHYVGLVYQCVEYARRWWMKNQGITFGSVDGANEIIYLKEGINIRTKEKFPLGRSINGTAKRPPQRGDLLTYYPLPEDPNWRWGHVAVVTAVDLHKGIVSIAEQNITNAKWEDPKAYARQIRLFQVADRYRVIDVSITDNKNPKGALISGWVYPMTK